MIATNDGIQSAVQARTEMKTGANLGGEGEVDESGGTDDARAGGLTELTSHSTTDIAEATVQSAKEGEKRKKGPAVRGKAEGWAIRGRALAMERLMHSESPYESGFHYSRARLNFRAVGRLCWS